MHPRLWPVDIVSLSCCNSRFHMQRADFSLAFISVVAVACPFSLTPPPQHPIRLLFSVCTCSIIIQHGNGQDLYTHYFCPYTFSCASLHVAMCLAWEPTQPADAFFLSQITIVVRATRPSILSQDTVAREPTRPADTLLLSQDRTPLLQSVV